MTVVYRLTLLLLIFLLLSSPIILLLLSLRLEASKPTGLLDSVCQRLGGTVI
jgi:hypothetical protein